MIKASVLLALAFGVARALRRRSAAERHLLWVAVLALAAVLPLLSVLLPAWQPEIARRAAAVLPAFAQAGAPDDGSEADVVVRADSVQLPLLEPTRVLVVIWLCGAALMVFATASASRRLARYGGAAAPVIEPSWHAAVSGVSHALGVTRAIRLLRSGHDSVPVTWGLLRPHILLPACSVEWSDERRRVVLAHELAHVSRGDWCIQLAARIVCGIYWFNPLFWLAYRQLCRESEQACDDSVLGLGVDRRDYATHLLEIARTLTSGPGVALAMARPSNLEQRIRVVLGAASSRRVPTLRCVSATALLAMVLAVPLAAVSVPSPLATIRVRTMGLPALPEAAGLPLDATPVTAIRDVRTSPSFLTSEDMVTPPEVIEYSSPPLYSDEARRRRIEGTVTLEVGVDTSGRVDVRRVVKGLGFGLDQNARLAVGHWEFRPARRGGLPVESITIIDIVFSLENDALNELIANDMATRVGPGVSPPRIVRRVPVQHDSRSAPGARSGSVLLDVVLLESGIPKVVRIARSLDATLDHEAVRAFEQWRFSPARKDGLPVKVRMNAEITFHRP